MNEKQGIFHLFELGAVCSIEFSSTRLKKREEDVRDRLEFSKLKCRIYLWHMTRFHFHSRWLVCDSHLSAHQIHRSLTSVVGNSSCSLTSVNRLEYYSLNLILTSAYGNNEEIVSVAYFRSSSMIERRVRDRETEKQQREKQRIETRKALKNIYYIDVSSMPFTSSAYE